MRHIDAMVVRRVERERDRTLLYGLTPDYYVIASKNAEVSVGDTVLYEAGGVNFGWFLSVAPEQEKEEKE